MVRSESVDSELSSGDTSPGRQQTLQISVVAPYLLLLSPSLWDRAGDPYEELDLYKYCSNRLTRKGEDNETVKRISELSVWQAACPRDTSVPARERMRAFAAEHLGETDAEQVDEMYELAIKTQAILWGNCLKEPAYNLTRMCDAVAAETLRVLDATVGRRGKPVLVEKVALAVTKRGRMSEEGMEVHVSYDGCAHSAKDVHIAFDRLMAGVLWQAADNVFMKPLEAAVKPGEKGGGGGEEEEEAEEREKPLDLLIRMAELNWQPEDKYGNALPIIRSRTQPPPRSSPGPNTKLESPISGDPSQPTGTRTRTVKPDVLQAALLSDNIRAIRRIVRRVHKAGSPEAVFTTSWNDEGPVTSPFERNLGSPVRSLTATCPLPRAPS